MKAGIFKTELVENLKLNSNCHKLVLKVNKNFLKAQPGQFVMIKTSNTEFPLLRRPLGIHMLRFYGQNFVLMELIFEIVGAGTRLLSEKKPKESLDIIGPLGKGFDFIPASMPILVAGGMGVAPLLFLAERLMKSGCGVRPLVILGARDKKQILCEGDFKKLNCQVRVATDDGSKGFKGYASDLLRDILDKIDRQKKVKNLFSQIAIYACGPALMLKEISQTALGYKLKAQVSLESHMACGVGACMGCVVATKDGFKRVCKEGPVFYAQDILW